MSTNEAWICPTCDLAISTPFCSGCGERLPGERDLTLRGLLHQFAEALSNIDGPSFVAFADW